MIIKDTLDKLIPIINTISLITDRTKQYDYVLSYIKEKEPYIKRFNSISEILGNDAKAFVVVHDKERYMQFASNLEYIYPTLDIYNYNNGYQIERDIFSKIDEVAINYYFNDISLSALQSRVMFYSNASIHNNYYILGNVCYEHFFKSKFITVDLPHNVIYVVPEKCFNMRYEYISDNMICMGICKLSNLNINYIKFNLNDIRWNER